MVKRDSFIFLTFPILILVFSIIMFGISTAGDIPDIPMVPVKGGCFGMDDIFNAKIKDEMPAHEVCVDDYYIGKYEVTQEQWMSVMDHNPSKFKGDNLPVEQVTWEEAQKFIAKLNERTGKKYRLPTEAEWEYAARGGSNKEKWSGTTDEKFLNDYVWHSKNSDGTTHEVGMKKPNSLGIYDMSGNVWEWVNDWYGETYYSESEKLNPKGPQTGSQKVLRGGSWYDDMSVARTSLREGSVPTMLMNLGFGNCLSALEGFRLAVSVK